MRIRPGAKRLTWHPAFQYPFESGWSILQKVKVLNNLCDDEVRELIAREQPPVRAYRLGDCADSSWIDFARFSELLEVPEYELRNGYWDQLGIQVERSMRYDRGYCIECWDARCYHCVLFDLTWLKKCPWHGGPIDVFKRQPLRLGARPSAWGGPPEVPFDDLLTLGPMHNMDRHRIMGYVLEYLEWWRAVQVQVPNADYLLRGLVSTYHQSDRDDNILQWQAGFATSRVPLRSGSWVLEGVQATPCRYTRLMDAGRRPQSADDRSTVRDDSGHCYRSIRRHIFRRYVRRHRACLAKLIRLDREELFSLVVEGVCATCLAYVVWRMSIENVVVMKGMFIRRTTNYRLRLTEPWPGSPSDDPTRLAFTYMQFFGIWEAIVNCRGFKGLQVSMQETVTEAQVVFAMDTVRPANAPLKMIHCLYPSGDPLAIAAGRPCKQPWRLMPYERQCAIRSQEWLASLTPPPKSILQIYLETDPDALTVMKRLYL